jgi:hypothetical protein
MPRSCRLVWLFTLVLSPRLLLAQTMPSNTGIDADQAKDVTITLTPSKVTIAPGQSISFAVSVSPQGLIPVLWFVNGVQGGDDRFGHISSTGSYSAPDHPDPNVRNIPISACFFVVPGGRFCDPGLTLHAEVTIDDAETAKKEIKKCSPECLDPYYGASVPLSSILAYQGQPNKLPSAVRSDMGESLPVPSGYDNKSDPNVFGSVSQDPLTYQAPQTIPTQPVFLNLPGKTKSDVAPFVPVVLMTHRTVFHCFSTDVQNKPAAGNCEVNDFDRTAPPRGTIWFPEPVKGKPGTFEARPHQVTNQTDPIEVNAINSSKALVNGSVLKIPLQKEFKNCANFDWKFVVQAREGTNIVIYGPGDVGAGVCGDKAYYIALPVTVLWADATAVMQHRDPERSAPGQPPTSFADCNGIEAVQSIRPCDLDQDGLRAHQLAALYALSPIYNLFTPPGAAQGSVSFSPALGSGQQYTFDLQGDPAVRLGKGWINFPVVFEKSATAGSNFNSLTTSVAYDFRWLASPNFGVECPLVRRVVVRKPQISLRSGAELQATRPHDLNWVEGEYVKLPIVANTKNQPSFFTFYPLLGLEEGSHIGTTIDKPILRGVAGFDGSVRLPYTFTHNFVGSSPATLDYTFHERWLAYAEPIVPSPGTSLALQLAGGSRNFTRVALNIPAYPFLTLTLTYSRGSLPPDFFVLGNTLSFGFTINNTGSSEH